MKKRCLIMLVVSIFILGAARVNAEVVDAEYGPIVNDFVSYTKYFRTVTLLNNSEVLSDAGKPITSFITEISEEEFNNSSNEEVNLEGNTDNSTKKITVKIEKAGNYFNYTAIAEWHRIPTLRSYDSIGLGHYPSVTLNGGPLFEQYYCISGGSCTSQTAGWRQYTSNYGEAATYYLPSGNLSVLKQTIFVTVRKTDPNSTVVRQEVTASYAQALTSVTYNEAKDFTISTAGIQFNSSSSNNKYGVTSALLKWTGTW